MAFELLLLAALAAEPRVSAAMALEDIKLNVEALARPLGFRVYRHASTGSYDPRRRRPIPGL